MLRRSLGIGVNQAGALGGSVRPKDEPVNPGAANDVLLIANGTHGFLLVDNSSFLKLVISS